MLSLSTYTHETAPSEFIEAEGVRYAYRRFGKQSGVPILFLSYLSSNMDSWDPIVTNGLAEDNEIILFDNAGVGASGGKCPTTVADMAKNCVAFCQALGLSKVDALGYSLGGMIAQQLSHDHPNLVRNLILLATGPRGGVDMTFTEISPEEQQADPVAFLLAALFAPSETSQKAGHEHVARLGLRAQDRDLPVSLDTTKLQIEALKEWGVVPTANRYAMLKDIPHHTLIVHGNKDIVVSPVNALIMEQHLPNAQLIIYPDSSHGTQYQHADLFLKHMDFFLNARS